MKPQSPNASITSDGADAANWTLPPDVTLNQTATGMPEDDSNISDDEARPSSTSNKAGIRLSKAGYYMFPTTDELDDLMDEHGRCVVQDFVIGRQVCLFYTLYVEPHWHNLPPFFFFY